MNEVRRQDKAEEVEETAMLQDFFESFRLSFSRVVLFRCSD